MAQQLDKETVELIRNLLERIPKGRELAISAIPIVETCDLAAVFTDLITRMMVKLTGFPPSQNETTRRRQEGCIVRVRVDVDGWLDFSARCWEERNTRLHFLGKFSEDIERLATRLPLTLPWRRYSKSLRRSRIGSVNAWAEIPRAQLLPDLAALELRLQELLNLTAARPDKPQLSDRSRKIVQIVGDDVFRRCTDTQIVAAVLKTVRRELEEPKLSPDALRVTLARIRQTLGHRPSKALRQAKEQ